MTKRGGAAARRRKENRRARLAEKHRVTTINVAQVFSPTPGGRTRSDGDFSAEEFRDEHLIPALKRCTDDEQVSVDLDGGAGYGASFLEEVFGGAVRKLGWNRCKDRILLVSHEEPHLVREIQDFMHDAASRRAKQ